LDRDLFPLGQLEAYRSDRYGKDAYGWPCFNIGSYSGEELSNPRGLANIKDSKSVIARISGILEREYGVNVLQPRTIPKGPHFLEIADQYLDSAKIHQFGFVPKIKMKDGLERTIKWYYDNFGFLKKYAAPYLI
jgi:CDP-glucose 4,6-dehydratase